MANHTRVRKPTLFEGNLAAAQQMVHSWVPSKQLSRQTGSSTESSGQFLIVPEVRTVVLTDAAEILGRGIGLGKANCQFARGQKPHVRIRGLGPKSGYFPYGRSVSEAPGVVIRITCRWMDVDKRKPWRLDYRVAKTSTDFSVERIAQDCCFPPNDIASSLPIAVTAWCRADVSSPGSGHHR